MRAVLASIGLAFLGSACSVARERADAPPTDPSPSVANSEATPADDAAFLREVVVHVVDVDGRPVVDAEVLALPASIDSADYPDLMFAGEVGRVDRWGRVARTQGDGAVTVRARHGDAVLVARAAGRWGTTTAADGDTKTRIVLTPEAQQRIVCVDAEGRPAQGAIAWIGVGDDDGSPGGELHWGALVTALDGTLDVPHAQHWRALLREGRSVQLAVFGLWSSEMVDDRTLAFPKVDAGPLRIEVSPGGFIELSSDEGLAARVALLRWLDAPPDVQDEYDAEDADIDVPEFPISLPFATPLAIPLGHRFEIVARIEGRVDPRVVFDGPTQPGQRVRVVLPRTEEAAQLAGRVVDAQGSPLRGAHVEAWLERDGVSVDPEDDWIVTDANGRFQLEFAPGEGGALNLIVNAHSEDLRAVFFALGEAGGFAQKRPQPTRLEIARLTAGTVDVGDVICRSKD